MRNEDETWKKYPGSRLIKRHSSGFYIIIPDDAGTVVPVSCPVCDFLLRSRDDEESYVEFECCNACALKWAHPRRAEWKAGWRPSHDDVIEVVGQRPPINAVIG